MKSLTPLTDDKLLDVDRNFRRVKRGVNDILVANDATNVRIDSLTTLVGSTVRAVLASTFTSTTTIAFQDTGLKLTLPAIGTYIIHCDLRVGNPSVAADFAVVRLYNQTTSTAVTDSERLSDYPTASNQGTQPLTEIITTTTISNIIRVEIKPSAARTCSLLTDTNGKSVMIAHRIA